MFHVIIILFVRIEYFRPNFLPIVPFAEDPSVCTLVDRVIVQKFRDTKIREKKGEGGRGGRFKRKRKRKEEEYIKGKERYKRIGGKKKREKRYK